VLSAHRDPDAPNIDPDAQLTEDEERRLYRHYELPPADAGEDDREVAAHDGEPPPANDRAGEDDADGDAPAAMTRSEEELIVGTRRRVSGRVRLKKYVVTEHVQKTVPVQREEVRVEYEPEEGPADR
jgi:stress response protein YsnF